MAHLSLTRKYLIGSVAALGTLLMGLPSFALQYNPPNRGAPSGTWDAGSRTGPCGNLTAVQPTQTNWGETLRARPSFGIYVSEPAKNLTFELKDEQTQEILHQVTFEQVDGPGISLYTLPDTAPALNINQHYRWTISLECEQFSTDKVTYVDTDIRQAGGVIFRRDASDELQADLLNTPDSEKPALLGDTGLWYDMLHILMIQRHQHADIDRWTEAWQTVIEHPMVQLAKLKEATLIDCCLTVDCLPLNASTPHY